MTKKLVPPDGGWGWAIVFASALNNLIAIPIMQNFGLIFKDTFEAMGLTHRDRSTIMNVNSAFGMLTGLINGALLKAFGFRKIALAGSALISSGVLLTAFSNSLSEYIVNYGIITSFGMGMGMSAFSLALNTYFDKRRGLATGFAMTITGLGPVIMPQLVSYLMSVHTTQGTTIIIGGLSLHTIVAALLLQPISWHLKEEVAEDVELCDQTEPSKEASSLMSNETSGEIIKKPIRTRENSIAEENALSIDHDIEVSAIYGYDTPLAGSVLSLAQGPQQAVNRKYSVQEQTVNKWWSSTSLNTVHLGSSIKIFDERGRRTSKAVNGINDSSVVKDINQESDQQVQDLDDTETGKKGLLQRIFSSVVRVFDLELLCDPIYVNIMVGMSLAVFAELTFSILTPFILADFGLGTSQIATFLSTLAVADIIFRFFAPFIGQYLKKPPRKMYMLTLVFLILTRFALLIFSTFPSLLGVAVALGVAKGVRTVYMSLVIPSSVPLDRLPTASGLQMMTNGIFIMTGGPIIGLIRDITGSYAMCITIMNAVTFTCIAMWSVEMIYMKCRNQEKEIKTITTVYNRK